MPYSYVILNILFVRDKELQVGVNLSHPTNSDDDDDVSISSTQVQELNVK